MAQFDVQIEDVEVDVCVLDEEVGGRRTRAEVSVALEGRAVDQAAEAEGAGDRRVTHDRQTSGVELAGEAVGAQVRDRRAEQERLKEGEGPVADEVEWRGAELIYRYVAFEREKGAARQIQDVGV